MIKALVLDFDGLILDTETPLIDAWAEVHARRGLVFDRARGHAIIGHQGVAFDPWEAFAAEIDRLDLETEFQSCKSEIIRRQLILPGVEALLDHAHATGLKLGVASNSHHDHVDGHLARLGLTNRFAAVVCRDDVPHPKPAPDVYATACRALGVAPAEAIAFEDSVPGHLAARAAGLPVVVVPNPSTRHCVFERATVQLTSLADLAPADLLARVATASGA